MSIPTKWVRCMAVSTGTGLIFGVNKKFKKIIFNFGNYSSEYKSQFTLVN